jgi:hypothetical protein
MPAGEIFVDIYADHGCSFAPSCLNCPFTVCRYDRGFAGNRVSQAINRVKRDRDVLKLRAKGMMVEEIAKATGVSGRTIARILSRRGPSRGDMGVVDEYGEDGQSTPPPETGPVGVKPRAPWPQIPGNQAPARQVFASSPGR